MSVPMCLHTLYRIVWGRWGGGNKDMCCVDQVQNLHTYVYHFNVKCRFGASLLCLRTKLQQQAVSFPCSTTHLLPIYLLLAAVLVETRFKHLNFPLHSSCQLRQQTASAIDKPLAPPPVQSPERVVPIVVLYLRLSLSRVFAKHSEKSSKIATNLEEWKWDSW